ncbi:MAG TPA: cupredoxin domain-containing protein [Candidatus Limnocylindria bacterium]|jgi:plastocyanin|nr:cupredoxin domain-containing protein [Candidatus Limnocylindria bacterium]
MPSRSVRRIALGTVLLGLLALVGAAACGTAPGGGAGGPPTAAALPPDMPVLSLAASSSAFDLELLHVPSGADFAVRLRNEDRDLHNIELRDAAGERLFVGELFRGPDERLAVLPALAAGQYAFLCTAHPFMKGVLLAE